MKHFFRKTSKWTVLNLPKFVFCVYLQKLRNTEKKKTLGQTVSVIRTNIFVVYCLLVITNKKLSRSKKGNISVTLISGSLFRSRLVKTPRKSRGSGHQVRYKITRWRNKYHRAAVLRFFKNLWATVKVKGPEVYDAASSVFRAHKY